MDKSSCDATDECWTKETVGVVTGANRGIGLEIARLLADKGITVVLTARCRQQQDLSPQSRALMEEGRKNVVFHTLDVQRDDSVTDFAQWLKNEFGGLDILFLRGETLQKQLSDIENISEEFIDCIVKQYMEDIERGADLRDSVWPVRFPTYSLSKVILNAYTRLLARELKGKACVNSVHPGYVRTSMTFNTGDISPVQGAENVVRVALLPPGGPTGQNFLETQIAHF